jgi:hypothetical protein
MGLLNSLKRLLGGGGSGSAPEAESDLSTVYVQCRRCGEPLKGRINLRNEPSQGEDGESWVVRKGLMGSGDNRCFQTVEVILTLDSQKKNIIDSEVTGGKLITAEEYRALLEQPQAQGEEENA